LGGALAANVHGRGLALQPFDADVIASTLIGPDGEPRRRGRTENGELCRLAAGGYGLVGVVIQLQLRLAPRQQRARVVEALEVDAVVPTMERRAGEGVRFGDWQLAIDPAGSDLRRLIDRAAEQGGSYDLTYHRFATRAQV